MAGSQISSNPSLAWRRLRGSRPSTIDVSRRRSARLSPAWLMLGLGAVIAPLLGLATALGLLPMLLLVALLGGAALLVLPMASLWVLAVGSICLAGLVELYLPAFQHIRWAFVAMAVLLAAQSLVGHLLAVRRQQAAPASGAHATLIVPLAALFFSVSTAAALLGGGGVFAALSGLKGYFQVWGLWIALTWSGLGMAGVSRFFAALLPMAAIQLPVALHQYLFLVPLRRGYELTTKGLVAIDVVSGTFGGTLFGGGRSPSLALLAMIGMALAIARYRTGRSRSLAFTWLLVVLCLAPLAISEVKIIFVFLPVTLLLLFGALLWRRPVAFLAGTALTLVALVGALVLYSSMIVVRSGSGGPVANYLNEVARYNTGSGGYGSAAVNRTTVYLFWFDRNVVHGSAKQALLGHGPGAVNATSTAAADSLAVREFAGFAPGLTGLSTLLWEVGLLGAGLFVALLVAGFRAAQSLARHPALKPWQAELQAARVAFVLLALSLLHNNLLLIDLATQAMLALALALVLAAGREVAQRPAGVVSTGRPPPVPAAAT